MSAAHPSDRRRRPLLWALVATAVVVATAAVATAGVLVLDATDTYPEVESAATEFGVQMNTYDASEPEEFLDRMEPFLDRGYRDDFAALVTPLLGDLARVAQRSDQARVDGVEVVATGGDEARVELAVSSRVSRLGETSGDRLPQRWTADLVERDGRWYVTAFAFSAGGTAPPPDAPSEDGPTSEV